MSVVVHKSLQRSGFCCARRSSRQARNSWAVSALLGCAPGKPAEGLGENPERQEPRQGGLSWPLGTRGWVGGRCPCELTPASPFIQGCPGREVPRLRELWPSVRGLSLSLSSLVCGPPSSLPLWLCTGHLGSRGHFACIRCLLHRTLGNVKTALFLFNFICQLFFVIIQKYS